VAALAKVRRQGYALVNEENIPGVLSVGAPIRDRSGAVVAALSVAFPKYLDSGLTLESVEPLISAAALRISRLLGMPPAMLLTGTTGSGSGGT
jgi:DNA-binding IclR family transcriptional regulator